MKCWWVPALVAVAVWAPASAQGVRTVPLVEPGPPPPLVTETPRRVRQGFLGVALAEVAPEAAKAGGLPPGAGASVEDVVPGSPAAAAGIRAGDILGSVNGKPVLSPVQLAADIRALAPGTKVKLTVARDGRRQDLEATLAEAPQPPPAQALRPLVPPAGGRAVPFEEVGRPDAPSPAEKLVTLDVQAHGLGETILRVLSGTGFPFRVAPELLDDAVLTARPFGHKATNTPLSQVLDALAGHYGIRWSMENGALSFASR